MPQSWDMGHIFYFPPKEGTLRFFTVPEKSNDLGRDRIRELGFQRPEC
jgi:hypothetical protein